jgi:hypothetical protein
VRIKEGGCEFGLKARRISRILAANHISFETHGLIETLHALRSGALSAFAVGRGRCPPITATYSASLLSYPKLLSFVRIVRTCNCQADDARMCLQSLRYSPVASQLESSPPHNPIPALRGVHKAPKAARLVKAAKFSGKRTRPIL